MAFVEIPAFFRLFRQGQALANADLWKNRTAAVNGLLAVFATLLELAKLAGYPVAIDQDTLETLAAGIFAAVGVGNSIMHVICNASAGLPAKSAN